MAVAGIVTRPDRPAGRGRKVEAGPVKRLADDQKVPVLQPERARDPSAIDDILAWRPGVMVVASYGEILPKRLIDAPPHQTLNLHPSLLPLYRGSSPVSGAILAGDTITGTSLMLITAKMDAGPILAQEQVAIAPDETRGELEERLARCSAELLLQRLPDWLKGAVTPVPQDESLATYTRRVSKEDGLIDWTQPAAEIALRVRAYNPWPSAFTAFEGRQLRVARSHAVSGAGEAGVVVELPGEVVAVGTGDGLLALDRIQLAGGRPMHAHNLLLGYRDIIGRRLG